jgi:tRNA(Ile)-lysidine synthase
MLLEELSRTTVENCGLDRQRIVLIGVSGGADSLALMHALHALGYRIVIAHLDHGLRAESGEDAAHVCQVAASLGLSIVDARVDVNAYADEHRQSIEEAAREVRYQFLFEKARLLDAQAVAVGHHADDQVETVLMHMLRGASLSGLSGMEYRRVMPIWDPEIPLVRPLLGIWRHEITRYLNEVGWTACEDASNQDTNYFRNRLRHELIPQLTSYNPKIKDILWRMSDVVREEDHLLGNLTEEAWKSVFVSGSETDIQLYRKGFVELPKPIRRRVLMRAIGMLRPDLRDVGFETLERGLKFAANPKTGSTLDLVSRLCLALIGDLLILKDWETELPDWQKALLPEPDFQAFLMPDNPVALRNGWKLEVHWFEELPQGLLEQVRNVGPNEVWLDAKFLELPLIVRSREEGERWQPLGMGGHHQSFQDFFITQKVPEHLRALWPLVCSGSEVAWVVGMRPSEKFKVTKRTKRILRLGVVRRM